MRVGRCLLRQQGEGFAGRAEGAQLLLPCSRHYTFLPGLAPARAPLPCSSLISGTTSTLPLQGGAALRDAAVRQVRGGGRGEDEAVRCSC